MNRKQLIRSSLGASLLVSFSFAAFAAQPAQCIKSSDGDGLLFYIEQLAVGLTMLITGLPVC